MTVAVVVTDSNDKNRVRTFAKWSNSRSHAAALFLFEKEAQSLDSDMAITSRTRTSHC